MNMDKAIPGMNSRLQCAFHKTVVHCGVLFYICFSGFVGMIPIRVYFNSLLLFINNLPHFLTINLLFLVFSFSFHNDYAFHDPQLLFALNEYVPVYSTIHFGKLAAELHTQNAATNLVIIRPMEAHSVP